jgi:hypothetical protein
VKLKRKKARKSSSTRKKDKKEEGKKDVSLACVANPTLFSFLLFSRILSPSLLTLPSSSHHLSLVSLRGGHPL